jgi:hypothetical protein
VAAVLELTGNHLLAQDKPMRTVTAAGVTPTRVNTPRMARMFANGRAVARVSFMMRRARGIDLPMLALGRLGKNRRAQQHTCNTDRGREHAAMMQMSHGSSPFLRKQSRDADHRPRRGREGSNFR